MTMLIDQPTTQLPLFGGEPIPTGLTADALVSRIMANPPVYKEVRPFRMRLRSLVADVEKEIYRRGIPYVKVDECKRALFASAKLRSFHYVAYAKSGANWLLWCGDPSADTRADMKEWAHVFGEGFKVVYAIRRAAGIVYRDADGKPIALESLQGE